MPEYDPITRKLVLNDGDEIPFTNAPNLDQVRDMHEQIRANMRRGLPMLKKEGQKNGTLIIVGGGPSVAKDEALIREMYKTPGNRVLCLNDSHDWLIERGIRPWGLVFWEVASMKGIIRFTQPGHPKNYVRYLLASQSWPDLFDALKGFNVLVWHARQESPGESELYLELDPKGFNIGGGCSALLRSINIGGQVMGFSKVHLFGADSSYDPITGQTHAYYNMRGYDPSYDPIDVKLPDGTQWATSYYLARQARDFNSCVIQWEDFRKKTGKGMDITVHGEGLLPQMAKMLGLHASQKGVK